MADGDGQGVFQPCIAPPDVQRVAGGVKAHVGRDEHVVSDDHLVGVQDGGMAMAAFLEAISPQTSAARKAEIEQQLLAYCALDTYAMVRLWAAFSNSSLKI